MAEDLEEFRREALRERRALQEKAQKIAQEKARDLEIGAISSDNPIAWDPEVRKALAELIKMKSLLGMVPPSLYQEAVEACEERLNIAIEKAKERLNDKEDETV